jgi:hypothetical protein
MDMLYFLKRRTAFLRSFYTHTSAAYIETKRKIETYEEPYSWPEGYDDSEPPFLAEWQEADEALEFLGQACVSFLSVTLKLFLNESERQFREDFDFLPIPALDLAAFEKNGFVEGYRQWFAAMGIDMEESGGDVTLMSEIVTTRNLSEHPKTISLMHLSQGEHERKKFPHPFFANPIEEAILTQQMEETGEDPGIPWMISIQPAKMLRVIDEVDKLSDWLEPMCRTYDVTFFTGSADAAGNHILTFKVRAKLSLSADGNEFTGVFQVDVFDPNGGLLASDTGTIRSRRIEVEPLP